jgi:trans-2,3-dihydro-3-hydroxyanthranilate isomerase
MLAINWQFFKCGTYTRESNAEIAAEINFAESTFITKMNPDEATAEIRIFTPVKEMQFGASNYWDVMGIDE